MASASAAPTRRPVRMRSLARATPMARGSRTVPPPPGMIPSPTSGSPISTPSAATRRSQASASSSPPPRAAPFSAATNACGADLDPAEGVAERLVEVVHLVGGHAGPLLEIRSGAEGPLPLAREHDAADGPVVADPDAGSRGAPGSWPGRARFAAPRRRWSRPRRPRAAPPPIPVRSCRSPPPRVAARARVASSACEVFPGRVRPTSSWASAPAEHELREVHAGLVPHAVEHVDEVLGGQVSRGARGVRAAPQPAHRRVEGGDAGLEPGQHVGERGAPGVVQVQRDGARIGPGTTRAPRSPGSGWGCPRRWCPRATPASSPGKAAARRWRRRDADPPCPRRGSPRRWRRNRARAARRRARARRPRRRPGTSRRWSCSRSSCCGSPTPRGRPRRRPAAAGWPCRGPRAAARAPFRSGRVPTYCTPGRTGSRATSSAESASAGIHLGRDEAGGLDARQSGVGQGARRARACRRSGRRAPRSGARRAAPPRRR